MSLMAKLGQRWSDDTDSMRDAIISNIHDIISSYAPIWIDDHSLNGTIAHIGIKNISGTQSKANSETILYEIRELIGYYEPRLSQVDIEFQNEEQNLLKFRISALMCRDNGVDTLVLDSYLNISSNKLNIRSNHLV